MLAVGWVCAVLILLSLGRDFGTDIDNYQEYLRDLDSDVTISSMEPLYIASARLLQALGLGRMSLLDVIAAASLALIAIFCARQRHPLAALVIVLGWLLLQQVWGTIRIGLGICVLLLLNDAFFRSGRLPWATWIAPVFHWSLIAHPLGLLVRMRPWVAMCLPIAVYAAVVMFGSFRNAFFAVVPSELEAIANYAVLQTGNAPTKPSPTPLLIHLALVAALTKTQSPSDCQRLLGPLTLLYCATCLFFDFEQIGTRVANILLSVKVIALIWIYDDAARLPGGLLIARPAILLYSAAVGMQYYLLHLEYF